MRFPGLLLAALACAGLLNEPAWGQAGQVQFASGDVQIQRSSGRKLPAVQGLAVEEGDTILTGPDGQTQLKMVDDGLLAVRPNTQIKLEAYRYAGREDGTERGIIGLLRGAFRSISGAIGRSNKDAYRIKTPSATIGIRGTDHESAFVVPNDANLPDVEPGTYNKVNSGETFIEANGQRVVLTADQAGFAGLAREMAPVRLREVPSFLRGDSRGSGSGRHGGKDDRNRDGREDRRDRDGREDRRDRDDARKSSALREGDRIGLRAGPMPPPPPVLPPPAPGTFDPAKLPPGIVPAPFLAAIVGGDVSPVIIGSGAGVVGVDLFAIVDAAGLMVRTGSPTFNYARNGAPVVDQGSAIIDGRPVHWGVYAGGEIKDGQGVRQPVFFHHMIAPSTTTVAQLLSAVTGSLTLSTVGGHTKPISEDGRVGGAVTGVSLTLVNATGINVSNYSIALTDASGRNWSGSQLTPVALRDFVSGTGAPLSVACSGCSATGGAGTAHGIPVGSFASPTQRGVVSSYDLHAGASGVTGSVLVK
jgi:hypothetical protein